MDLETIDGSSRPWVGEGWIKNEQRMARVGAGVSPYRPPFRLLKEELGTAGLFEEKKREWG